MVLGIGERKSFSSLIILFDMFDAWFQKNINSIAFCVSQIIPATIGQNCRAAGLTISL